jgi:hypothetical protein
MPPPNSTLTIVLAPSAGGNDNDLEQDRQRIEYGYSGFTGQPVAQKEMEM